MKKTFLFLTAWMLTLPCTIFANVIDMGGTNAVIDTMESFQAGPGTVYSHLKMTKGSKVRHMYLLDVDLTDPNITLETIISKDQFQTYETLAAMSQRLDAPNHRMIGGINANFWCVGATIEASPNEYEGQSGMPLQGCVSNGMIGTDVTGWDRVNASHNPDSADYDIGHLAFTADRKAVVCDMCADNWMKVGDAKLGFRDVNRKRTFTGEDRITLYNKFAGTTPTGLCGKEVVFSVSGDWRINQDMTCTVLSINTTGGTNLAGTTNGAIQGFNGGCNILNLLNVGDTFTLHTGVNTRVDNVKHDIRQMVAGNALVMVHGQLTGRNYNEGYNSGDYPRPVLGANAEGTRVWLLECAPTAGMTTAEACYVLRSMGATDAGAYDGGGSAQMFVLGENKFKTTESTPRSLPLGMWVVATCDDSEDAGQLAFVEPLKSIPAYAGYTPQVRAWTKDGLFISHDYKKHTLRCEPASLGTISADGLTFTANPVDGTGKLIAEYGTAYTETPIEIKDGQIAIRLDSLVLGNTDYKVEVNAVAGSLILPMDAKALAWQSSDESVATINTDGVLHGLHNGTTSVSGSLGGYTDLLKVKVELADAPRLRSDGQEAIGEWAGHKDTVFQIKSVRTGTLTMPLDEMTYGCPDSIILMVNTDSPVASLELAMNVGDSIEEQSYKLAQSLTANTDETVIFAVGKMLNKEDRGIYPIRLNSVKFGFKNPKANKDYNMHIKDIILCYSDWHKVTGLMNTMRQMGDNACRKVMVKGKIYIINHNKLFTVEGHEIIEKH